MTMARSVPPIRLRAPELEDLDIMMFFENDENLWENGIVTGPYSRYQLKQYIEQNTNDLYADRQLRLMIEHSQAGVVGIVDLCSFDPRHSRAEIGVVVLEEYRCQGIASEALRQLEYHCFSRLGIHQLYAYVHADNEPSLHLFAALGYARTGYLPHWIYTGQGYKDVCLLQKFSPFSVE